MTNILESIFQDIKLIIKSKYTKSPYVKFQSLSFEGLSFIACMLEVSKFRWKCKLKNHREEDE
jgi:hypothetical protein